jgi:xylose isomerase
VVSRDGDVLGLLCSHTHTHTHTHHAASAFGFLGSVDANTGDPLLGWDTDQFNMDVKQTTLAMQVVLRQGGLQPGGLNFDAKLRRESSDLEDLFIGHIAGTPPPPYKLLDPKRHAHDTHTTHN